MQNEEEIINDFFKLKKVIYIEKNEQDEIINTNKPKILSIYQEIINSDIVEDNYYYHKESKKWYKITPTIVNNRKIEYLEDVTDIKLKMYKLKIDSLTGVMKSRREANKLMNSYIEKALETKEEFSILVGDIDDFKTINDTYGHHCGDLILKMVSGILLKNINVGNDAFDKAESDIILRFGGDEFLIFLKNITEEETKKKLEQIQKEINKASLDYKNNTVKTTISFGYCHYPNDKKYNYENIEELRMKLGDQADKKLYKNKRHRNKK